MMRKSSLILLSAAAGAALTFLAIQPPAAIVGASAQPVAATDTYRHLDLFSDVFARVRARHVGKPDDSVLVDAALNGMLNGLDPYSGYVSAQSLRELPPHVLGLPGGLGIEVTMEDGLLTVVSPIDDTPAARAGIMANDIITHLDDEPVQGLTLYQALDKMRGPADARIGLRIVRKGRDKPLDVTIVREAVRVQSVRLRNEGDDIGYIRIAQFNEQTTDALQKALDDVAPRLAGDKLKGFVIDLRNNPGGLLDQAISVSDVFLEKGEIVSIRGRNADATQRFNARPGDLSRGRPIIVLINGGSAAAAEIVAGALQDNKRATIIGTRSFGKGSVQTIIPLGAGNGALRLTTARYFTPAGRSIQAKGITPDIEVLQDVPEELKPRADSKNDAPLRGRPSAAGSEQTGSQGYVPPEPKDDKALNLAYDLLRGAKVDAAFPPDRKAAVPN